MRFGLGPSNQQNSRVPLHGLTLCHVATLTCTAWCNEIGSLTSLMHVTQVHPVTTENQFHCTRLYSSKTTSQFGLLVYFIGNPTGGMPENPVYKEDTGRTSEEKRLDKLLKNLESGVSVVS